MKYYRFIVENLDFDQLLLEIRGGRQAGKVHCLHVSYNNEGTNRRQAISNYVVH